MIKLPVTALARASDTPGIALAWLRAASTANSSPFNRGVCNRNRPGTWWMYSIFLSVRSGTSMFTLSHCYYNLMTVETSDRVGNGSLSEPRHESWHFGIRRGRIAEVPWADDTSPRQATGGGPMVALTTGVLLPPRTCIRSPW